MKWEFAPDKTNAQYNFQVTDNDPRFEIFTNERALSGQKYNLWKSWCAQNTERFKSNNDDLH